MQKTPTDNDIQDALDAGVAALELGRQTRDYHRGKRRPSRSLSLEFALAVCENAARDYRSYVGMAFAHEIDLNREIEMRRMTKKLDAERRALRKMRSPYSS